MGEVGVGLLVLVGIHRDDTATDAAKLADKVCHLRIFDDADGKMNRSVLEIAGAALVVSNFTVHADTRKGRRPSFNRSADYEKGSQLFSAFCERLAEHGVPMATGEYGAMMDVSLVNQGPVTVIVDS